MRGNSVVDAHPILRMFQVCEAMNWAHLPVAGGIYDQSSDLLDGFLIIFSERAKFDAEEAKKQERENARGMGKTSSRGATRGRH